jgi:hypothetical protein
MIVTEMERGAAIFYQRFFIPTALNISRCVSWMIKSSLIVIPHTNVTPYREKWVSDPLFAYAPLL